MVLGSQRCPRLIADSPAACNRADWVRGRKADKKKDHYRYRKKYRYKKEEPFQDIPNREMHFKPIETIP